MSDFDKEAEREKLRKKYEQDQKEREATKRMSDLLLKGARMTNTHCDTCGDPLFEQNGVTFCPTCHGGPEGVEASLDEGADSEGEEAAGDSPADDSSTASAEGGTAADGETTAAASGAEGASADATGAEPAGATDPASGTTERAVDEGAADGPRAQAEPSSESRGRSPPAETTVPNGAGIESAQPTAPARGGRAPASSTAVGGDLETARDALVEALERFSRRAAETDDPRYAKECLEAAREAGEALAALR